jgi:hypothetical protein
MLKRLGLVLLAGILLSGCSIPGLAGQQKSGLQITATPQATVFLNGNSVGMTPVMQEDLKPGEYTVKLTPTDNSLQPWETKIKLTPGVLTVVDRKLAPSLDQSHGHTLSFEKISQKQKAEVAITSLPDSVNVNVDGSPQGFTPVSLDTISEGDHTIILSSPGFEDKVIKARSLNGYRLTINAQLAKKVEAPEIDLTDTEATPSADISPSVSPTSTPTPTKKLTPSPTKTASGSAEVKKPYVEISTTPTGWLRVRSEASSAGTELAKVNTGEKFPYLATDSTGWVQIEYSTGKKGWVSSQYVKVVK